MMLLKYIILFSSTLSCCFAQTAIGKVNIGVEGANVTTAITFSVNDAAANQRIPVYVTVVDITDPTVTVTEPVTVTCEITTQDGYSSATFSTITLSNTATSGNIQLSNINVGRGVEVRCFGTSTAQFTKEASTTTALLTITPAPKVSICTTDDIIIQDVTTQQQFSVSLSDTVKDNAVTVTCSSGGGGTTVIALNTATVAVGTPSTNPQLGDKEVTQVTFTLTTAGTNITVSCSAQSTGGGTQYTTASSQGAAVAFRMNSPSLDLYPRQYTTTTTSFNLLLVLRSPPRIDSVPLTCQANKVNTTAEVTAGLTTPPCSTGGTAPTAATPDTTSTTLVEADWATLPVTNLEPLVDNPVLFSRVTVTRNIEAVSPVTEYIVVSCCATGVSTSVFVVAYLTPNRTIDFSKATVPGSETTESDYPNPAYVDVAPCACDITTSLCDFGCCCDSDCSTEEKGAFDACIPGLPGGQSAPVPDYKCLSEHFNKADWFPIMCVEREFNALIGFYYSNTAALRTAPAVNQKVNEEKFYSYKETENRVALSFTRPYIQGDPVKAYQQGVSPRLGPLVLPQRILSGECIAESTVQFLKDFSSECNHELTQAECSVGSSFNPLFYAESSTTKDPACPNPFVAMGNSATSAIAETNVHYYCATDFTSYVKSTVTQVLVTPNTTYTFDYSLPSLSDQDACGNDANQAYATDSTATGLPPRCTWDDGYTQPSQLVLNGANCDNTVLEVRYKFYWSGQQITKLDAIVILGNVPVSTTAAPVVITQKFSSEFAHSYSGNFLNTADNYMKVDATFARSGKPGYELNKPLLSGMLTSETGNNYVNQNRSRQLALWDTGPDGLCRNSGKKTIPFGIDSFSSCNLHLSAADLSGDCTDLRKLIINRLNFLVAPADKIGQYGNNNPWEVSQWIDIKRENLDHVCQRNVNETVDYILSLSTTGLCVDMISGVQLNIIYAETGRSKGYPILEVLGANLTYVNSTWRMQCFSGGNSACNGVEPFQLTMSVNFIKSTPNRPARPDKYYAERSTTCQRDVCWRDLILPLTSTYDFEEKQYVQAMVLISILGIVAYMIVTWPWW